jgi:hypothetical protein
VLWRDIFPLLILDSVLEREERDAPRAKRFALGILGEFYPAHSFIVNFNGIIVFVPLIHWIKIREICLMDKE